MSSLTPVAFDIETTGFETTAQSTVLGLVFPAGVRVFVNTDGRSVSAEHLQNEQRALFDEQIVLSVHDSEQQLFETFSKTVREKVAPRDYLLTAYNGELWRSGFDLPFLRTRFLSHESQWPFADVPYADLLPIFKSRFNTAGLGESEQKATLEHVYETLVGGKLTELDPFETSAEAVDAFEAGDFESLVQHNIADILRTQALATVAEKYCSKSDFKLKSLSPTRSH